MVVQLREREHRCKDYFKLLNNGKLLVPKSTKSSRKLISNSKLGNFLN